MNTELSRRELASLFPAAGLLDFQVPAGAAALWPGFPHMELTLAAQVVGESHRDEAKVKELVTAHPSLANASWDWGFGDWETALGAASHTGQRGIAEFLIEKGARIDLFAAAMLGMTDVVKSLIVAQPGIERTLGPHGIPLLNHALAGEAKAAGTLAYLKTLPGAAAGIPVMPLSDDRKRSYFGTFRSDETGVTLTVRLNMAGKLLMDIQVGKESPNSRLIYCVGEDEFFPSGVPSVKIKFARGEGVVREVSLFRGKLILSANRVGG